jgi:hypothetical protein
MNSSTLNQDHQQTPDEIPESPVVMQAWAQQLLSRTSLNRKDWLNTGEAPVHLRAYSSGAVGPASFEATRGVKPPVQLTSDERDVRRLHKAVERIRRSTPAIEAETELRRILIAEMRRLHSEGCEDELWNETQELAQELMLHYRLLGRPVLTMGKLLEMRKASWEKWCVAVHERGLDPDQHPDPEDETRLDDRTFERLLRLGPASARMEGIEAVQFIAWFLLESGQIKIWESPTDAIEDIVDWARCAWPLRHGDEQATRQSCKNAWNSLLPMVPPTVAMVRTVIAIEPCTGRQPPKKPSAKKRIGLLRLLQRLVAQVRFWPTLGQVELPTEWLTQAKDTTSDTTIIGISNNTYGLVLARMTQLGILLPMGEANHLAHQCAKFELRLKCGDDPTVDDAVVADAEDLVSTSPDHVIEEVIAAVEKAATAEAQEAEQPTA